MTQGKKGSEHYRWNKGKIISSDGYVKIRVGKSHPLADPNGYASEHLLVWISAGDALESNEVLRHLNGDRQDNRWENLQRMTKAELALCITRIEGAMSYRCPYCHSPLADYDTARDGEALWCADCSNRVEYVDAMAAYEESVSSTGPSNSGGREGET